ncbi:TetR/AcrR family transcriptional regulator [Nocardia sp. PE-7]|uniref:TetR/AcrR family transcriptional regulator n=1 Tax=Nocardia sp. PE-7 TaxID=3058426 RepID=UPI00265A4848|nr:TetR/AcrR family transcriptional regulator [Nocardia sp. PE-7]WKG12563.1 TetR/AcrR family transcriptional regulator [Nocardia sp. PE-7]
MTAATHAIATQGLGASTATIAKKAGVSNGSLFVYFDTKVVLLNELFVALKTEMAESSLVGIPSEEEPREQMLHVWTQWMRWATASPDKRRAVAQLLVSDDITAASHELANNAFGAMADLLERSRVGGPMEHAPLTFVLTLTNTIAEATIDAVIREPANAETLTRLAFDATWRVIAGK